MGCKPKMENKETPLPRATLDVKFQEWLIEEEARRLHVKQDQKACVAKPLDTKVPHVSHVVPVPCVMGRRRLVDAPRDWAKEQQKEDELTKKIEECFTLKSVVTAAHGNRVQNTLSDLARLALMSELPPAPTHKPGVPRK